MSGELLDSADEETADGSEDPSDPTPVLELDNVSKGYGDASVIRDLSLEVHDGELLTLLGPSGCGKTTTLRLVAGLETPDGGTIRLDGKDVADVPPEQRDVGVVFQEFALFPHLTARENVGFGLTELNEMDRERRVDELLELVGLSDHGHKQPDELSGGQQQRVALARSLAPEPNLLLLDEPFSNLDVDLRVEMRQEVRRILDQAGVTAVNVTHDQEEAMSISDRVAVMYDGAIEQVGTPEHVFQHPESRFVASFLGHASFVSGHVEGERVNTAIGSVGLDRVHGLTPAYDGSDIDLLVRPDDLRARPMADHADANGEVMERRFLGPTVHYRIRLDSGETVGCTHNHADEVPLGERVRLELAAEHDLAWFPQGARRVPDGGAPE